MNVTYELYTLAGGRWMLDTSFKKDEQQRAIYEGQLLHKGGGFQAVKVVREMFGDSRVLEKVIYNSQSRATSEDALGVSAGTGESARAGSLSFGSDNLFGDEAPTVGVSPAAPRRAACAPSRSAMSPMGVLLTKLALITVLSFAFASMTTLAYGLSGL